MTSPSLTRTVLNPQIVRFDPHYEGGESTAQDPALCLLFGWMGARPVHLAKYTDALHKLFPSSPILVVQSPATFFVSSQSARELALRPVVRALLELATEDRLASGILIHCFSNGGGFELLTLQALLSRTLPERLEQAPAPCALVLDSCPGDHGLASAISSMASASPVLYWAAAPVIALLYGIFALLERIGGRLPIFHRMRAGLLQRELLPPFVGDSVKRLYVYSASDDKVHAGDVEAHIALARHKGLVFKAEKFVESAHVSHAKTDGGRYWEAVMNVWREAKSKAVAEGSDRDTGVLL